MLIKTLFYLTPGPSPCEGEGRFTSHTKIVMAGFMLTGLTRSAVAVSDTPLLHRERGRG